MKRDVIIKDEPEGNGFTMWAWKARHMKSPFLVEGSGIRIFVAKTK